MKMYLLQTTHAIAPFGDHPRDCLIAGQRLGQHQASVLHRLGHEPVIVTDTTQIHDAGEYLVCEDCLYFTPELLQEFVTRSRQVGRPTFCALTPGLTTLRAYVATQGVPTSAERIDYALQYVPLGSSSSAEPLVIDPDRFWQPLPMPHHMFDSDEYRMPSSERLLIRINHWTNVLAANQLALLAEGARLRLAPRLRLAQLALRARSRNPWRILSHYNSIGQDCDIHPTAYLEACTIGDKVKIGARAVLRGTVVGSGSYIGNGAIMELAAVGEHCNIMNGCMVQGSVLYPGTFTMARLISASVCGYDTFLGDGVTLTDFRFDHHTVTVQDAGIVVDTGNGVLGSCLGHGVYLGAGSVVAPGRTVANGLHIAPTAERVIRSSPPSGEIPGYRVVRTHGVADQPGDKEL